MDPKLRIDLRDALAHLYPDVDDARRVADDAGVLAFATVVFFVTSLTSSMRLVFNLSAWLVVAISAPIITEPQAFVRFMALRLRYGEHFHVRLPHAAKTLEYLREPRNCGRASRPWDLGERPYEEAIQNCRRCSALADLVSTGAPVTVAPDASAPQARGVPTA